MTITAENIIIGPCSSFKVDTTDVGATQGGVSVNARETFRNISADQIIGTIKKARTNRTLQVVTTMLETTLENLKVAWDLNTAITTDGESGDKTLGIGMDVTTEEHTLEFVGPGPSGATRTFSLNRAVGYASGNLQLRKDNESVVQVTFDCMPDMTQPIGTEYGTITEATA